MQFVHYKNEGRFWVVAVVNNYTYKMINSLISLCLVILLCVPAAAASGTKIYSISGQEGKFVSSPVAPDAICKSMVQTQGYICHEHTVPHLISVSTFCPIQSNCFTLIVIYE